MGAADEAGVDIGVSLPGAAELAVDPSETHTWIRLADAVDSGGGTRRGSAPGGAGVFAPRGGLTHEMECMCASCGADSRGDLLVMVGARAALAESRAGRRAMSTEVGGATSERALILEHEAESAPPTPTQWSSAMMPEV